MELDEVRRASRIGDEAASGRFGSLARELLAERTCSFDLTDECKLIAA